MRRLWIAICLLVLSALWPALLSARPLECTGKAAQAQLSAINPVYVDAMELARHLIDYGFIVRCVQGSKMQNVFDGQTGAALYVTDEGSFDVLFLPKEQSFSGVQLIEQNEGKRYRLSFRGIPSSRFHMDGFGGNKAPYFIRCDNLLFVAWSDAKLAATIQNKIPGAHALSAAP
jgi:hypothetical protein